MLKKLVIIGGGENGRLLENGQFAIYDTMSIDKEIVKLAHKEKPNFLFICHAFSSSLEIQESYFQTMSKIYGGIFGCQCLDLKSNELNFKKIVKEKIKWADIIYEGGGDTFSMIELWQKSGFDKILYQAWQKGKVISGISAGAVCWFNSCNSDTNNGFESIKCLNWFNAFVTPHADEKGRIQSTKEELKNCQLVGLLISNRAAIEFIDEKYQILLSDFEDEKLVKPFVEKIYWINGKLVKRNLTNYYCFKSILHLFTKN